MLKNDSPIGVFDSGVGGISVLKNLYSIMPNENYIYFGDSLNAPYGTKPEAIIKKHTEDNIKFLISKNVKAIVIACNTATSVAASELRKKYDIPIIGIEPAIKPACINHKGSKILVMATPVTLKKEKFINLMNNYNEISQIIPLPCPNLVEIIESGTVYGKQIDNYLKNLFMPFKKEEIGSVVLGCTHYPFIKESIEKFFNYKVDIIDGGMGTAKETERRLKENSMINSLKNKGHITFLSSKNKKEELELMENMFNSFKI